VVSMKMAVFWVETLYNLIEVYQCFRALMMEEASTSDMIVNFYQTSQKTDIFCFLGLLSVVRIIK
jgi:hypothetical protein